MQLDFLEISFVTECLRVIQEDLHLVTREVKLKNSNFSDKACEIAQLTIRRQLSYYFQALHNDFLKTIQEL